jgi:hypothetical protein
VRFHAAGQATAGKGELELRELLARPDPDGGEVPDIVVGSYIWSPFSFKSLQLSYGATASVPARLAT